VSNEEKIFLEKQRISDEAQQKLEAFQKQHSAVLEVFFDLLDKHIDATNEKNRAFNKIQK